jgi:hypothetical protein
MTAEMLPNKNYRISVYSPGTSGANAYQLSILETDGAEARINTGYGGFVSSLTFSGNGTNWTVDPARDLPFTIWSSNVFPYKQAGELVSSAFKIESGVANYISWIESIPQLCGGLCGISLQIQTTTDNAGIPNTWPSYWSGPLGKDGEENDEFTIKTGQIIHADHNGDQWIRYRAKLWGDTNYTPILSAVITSHK